MRPGMRKHMQCLAMCAQNLTILITFLTMHIASVSIKLLLVVQQTMRNPIQFTELVWLAQKLRYVIEVM